MGKTIKPDQLAKEVMDGLEEYADLTADRTVRKELVGEENERDA